MPTAVMGILFAIALLYSLFVLVPSLALAWRRFHDCSLSGWWAFGLMLGSAIPVVGLIPSLALLVVQGFLPGSPQENRFGEGAIAPVAPEPKLVWPKAEQG